MSTPRSSRLALALSLALVGLVAGGSVASADRDRSYRRGSGGTVRGEARVGVRPYSRGGRPFRPTGGRWVRTPYYPRAYWGGGFYVGGYYATRPCYECGYYQQPYYAQPYYAQPAVAVAVASRPPLPRFGLGLFAGGSSWESGAQGRVESDDIGLLGRFRLTPHLQLEGELSKSEMLDGQRVDRSLGGALLYDFAPWSVLSLNLLAGVGAGSTRIAGDVDAHHVYGEVGVGLEWRLTPRFSLFADLRAGQRDVELEDDAVTARVIQSGDANRPTDYGRGRVGVLLFF